MLGVMRNRLKLSIASAILGMLSLGVNSGVESSFASQISPRVLNFSVLNKNQIDNSTSSETLQFTILEQADSQATSVNLNFVNTSDSTQTLNASASYVANSGNVYSYSGMLTIPMAAKGGTWNLVSANFGTTTTNYGKYAFTLFNNSYQTYNSAIDALAQKIQNHNSPIQEYNERLNQLLSKYPQLLILNELKLELANFQLYQLDTATLTSQAAVDSAMNAYTAWLSTQPSGADIVSKFNSMEVTVASLVAGKKAEEGQIAAFKSLLTSDIKKYPSATTYLKTLMTSVPSEDQIIKAFNLFGSTSLVFDQKSISDTISLDLTKIHNFDACAKKANKRNVNKCVQP